MTGTVDGEDLGPVHRPPRPDDRRRPAPRLPHRAAARRRASATCGSSIDAEGYRARRAEALQRQADEAADDALRYGRPGGAGRDDGQRAQARARVPARPRRRRDVQRGRGARPPPRRRAAASPSRRGFTFNGVALTRCRADWPRLGRALRASRAAPIERLAGAARARRGRAGGRSPPSAIRPRASTSTWPTRSSALELPAVRDAPRDRRPRLRRRVSRASCSPSRCPRAHVALVESVGRKCAFLAARSASSGSTNVERRQRARRGVAGRARRARRRRRRGRSPRWPSWSSTRRRCCALGGALVAWKGRRDAAEEADGAAPRPRRSGMSGPAIAPRRARSRAPSDRHLYV